MLVELSVDLGNLPTTVIEDIPQADRDRIAVSFCKCGKKHNSQLGAGAPACCILCPT
jgi:uncharacterized protein YejL (UPF0352 family)